MQCHLDVFSLWPEFKQRHQLDRYYLISRLSAGAKFPELLDPREYRRRQSPFRAQSITVAPIDEEAVCGHGGQALADEPPRDEFFSQFHDLHASAGPSEHHDHRADRERGDHGIVEGHVENEEANIEQNPPNHRHDRTAVSERKPMQNGCRRPKADCNPRELREKHTLIDTSLRFRTGPADHGQMRCKKYCEPQQSYEQSKDHATSSALGAARANSCSQVKSWATRWPFGVSTRSSPSTFTSPALCMSSRRLVYIHAI